MADEINTGDIIICHRSGWWKVIGDDSVSINYYGQKVTGRLMVELVMDKSGRIPKKNPRKLSVHKSCCQKLTPELIKDFKQKENKKWDTLLFIVDPSQKEIGEEISEGLEGISKPEPSYLTRLDPPQSIFKK